MHTEQFVDEKAAMLYARITGQLTHDSPLDEPMQKAAAAYQSAINMFDSAEKAVGNYMQTEEQEEALEKLAGCSDRLAETMFAQGYALGRANHDSAIQDDCKGTMRILPPNYGSAPEPLVKKHQAIAFCMGSLFEIDPQAPELEALRNIALQLEVQIAKLNPGY